MTAARARLGVALLLAALVDLGHAADLGTPRPAPSADQQAAIARLSGILQRADRGAMSSADQGFVDQAGRAMLDGRKPGGVVGQAIQREVSARRDAVSRLMGLDPEQGSLYVFVSHSMPDGLIRSYLREAMWTGGTLVVRGIPYGQKIGAYLRGTLWPMMQHTGSMGAFTIHPPLFDMYGIDTVPAVVWDERDVTERVCIGYQASARLPNQHVVEQKRCRPASPDSFWKVGGAVTVDWALQQFAEAGSTQAAARLKLMRARLGAPGKTQHPFTGDWTRVVKAEDALGDQRVEAELQRRRQRDEELLSPVVVPMRR